MDRYFIYQRTGGLGDMIFGLYLAWRYCDKYNRKLFVNWKGSTYLQDETNIFSLLFDDDFKILNVPIKAYDNDMEFPTPFYPNNIDNEFVRKNWRYKEFLKDGIFHVDENEEYGSIKKAQKIFLPIYELKDIEEPTIHTGRQITLVLPSKAVPAERLMISYFLKNLILNYKQNIKDAIEKEARRLFHDGKIHIGIHIRNGNGLPFYYNYDSKKTYESDLENLIETKMEIIDGTGLSYDKIFLCTDTQEIENIFMDKYSHKAITYGKTELKKGKEPHFVSNMEDPLKVMMEALIELNLLSYCNYLFSICPQRSSFSIVPSFIGKRPKLYMI
jgi:hypothetical protein